MMMLYLPSGSPTAELFAASYNNRSNKSNIIELELGTDGYTENTKKNWLKPEDNHGIYNKSTSSYWLLASPRNFCTSELRVIGNNGFLGSSYVGDIYDVNDSYAVRPLVCIPTSVFNSKYATDTTLVNQ